MNIKIVSLIQFSISILTLCHQPTVCIPDFLAVKTLEVRVVHQPSRKYYIKPASSLNRKPAQKVDDHFVLIDAQMGKDHEKGLHQ